MSKKEKTEQQRIWTRKLKNIVFKGLSQSKVIDAIYQKHERTLDKGNLSRFVNGDMPTIKTWLKISDTNSIQVLLWKYLDEQSGTQNTKSTLVKYARELGFFESQDEFNLDLPFHRLFPQIHQSQIKLKRPIRCHYEFKKPQSQTIFSNQSKVPPKSILIRYQSIEEIDSVYETISIENPSYKIDTQHVSNYREQFNKYKYENKYEKVYDVHDWNHESIIDLIEQLTRPVIPLRQSQKDNLIRYKTFLIGHPDQLAPLTFRDDVIKLVYQASINKMSSLKDHCELLIESYKEQIFDSLLKKPTRGLNQDKIIAILCRVYLDNDFRESHWYAHILLEFELTKQLSSISSESAKDKRVKEILNQFRTLGLITTDLRLEYRLFAQLLTAKKLACGELTWSECVNHPDAFLIFKWSIILGLSWTDIEPCFNLETFSPIDRAKSVIYYQVYSRLEKNKKQIKDLEIKQSVYDLLYTIKHDLLRIRSSSNFKEILGFERHLIDRTDQFDFEVLRQLDLNNLGAIEVLEIKKHIYLIEQESSFEIKEYYTKWQTKYSSWSSRELEPKQLQYFVNYLMPHSVLPNENYTFCISHADGDQREALIISSLFRCQRAFRKLVDEDDLNWIIKRYFSQELNGKRTELYLHQLIEVLHEKYVSTAMINFSAHKGHIDHSLSEEQAKALIDHLDRITSQYLRFTRSMITPNNPDFYLQYKQVIKVWYRYLNEYLGSIRDVILIKLLSFNVFVDLNMLVSAERNSSQSETFSTILNINNSYITSWLGNDHFYPRHSFLIEDCVHVYSHSPECSLQVNSAWFDLLLDAEQQDLIQLILTYFYTNSSIYSIGYLDYISKYVRKSKHQMNIVKMIADKLIGKQEEGLAFVIRNRIPSWDEDMPQKISNELTWRYYLDPYLIPGFDHADVVILVNQFISQRETLIKKASGTYDDSKKPMLYHLLEFIEHMIASKDYSALESTYLCTVNHPIQFKTEPSCEEKFYKQALGLITNRLRSCDHYERYNQLIGIEMPKTNIRVYFEYLRIVRDHNKKLEELSKEQDELFNSFSCKNSDLEDTTLDYMKPGMLLDDQNQYDQELNLIIDADHDKRETLINNSEGYICSKLKRPYYKYNENDLAKYEYVQKLSKLLYEYNLKKCNWSATLLFAKFAQLKTKECKILLDQLPFNQALTLFKDNRDHFGFSITDHTSSSNHNEWKPTLFKDIKGGLGTYIALFHKTLNDDEFIDFMTQLSERLKQAESMRDLDDNVDLVEIYFSDQFSILEICERLKPQKVYELGLDYFYPFDSLSYSVEEFWAEKIPLKKLIEEVQIRLQHKDSNLTGLKESKRTRRFFRTLCQRKRDYLPKLSKSICTNKDLNDDQVYNLYYHITEHLEPSETDQIQEFMLGSNYSQTKQLVIEDILSSSYNKALLHQALLVDEPVDESGY